MFFALLLAVVEEANGQSQSESYAIHRVNVIDVNTKQLIKHQTVVVEKDRIIGIFNSNDFSNKDSIQLLDFSGHYMLPGLIDAHVHLASNPSKEDNYETTKKRLDFLLKNGVTAVRDMAGDARFLSFVSRQAALDEISSPDIYYSALIAGDSFFKDPRTALAAQGLETGKAPWMRGVNETSNLTQVIAEAKGTGATGIKIYADLNASFVQRLVREAHAQQLKVWAHATVFPARPSEVCKSGVDVMSHANYLAWEGEKDIPADASYRFRKLDEFDSNNAVFTSLMKDMARHQTILDATVSVSKRRFPDSTLFNYGVALTKLAYRHHISIGVGTDLPIDVSATPPIVQEMLSLQDDVGMKPIDIIRGATLVNAQMIGKENDMGTIEIGKRANIVILKNNPMEDINHIKSRVLVIKNGQRINTN